MKVYGDFGDGWQPVESKNLRIACCDCGLTHVMHIRKRGGVFEMKIDRDERATAQIRRHNAHECEPRQPRRPRKAMREDSRS